MNNLFTEMTDVPDAETPKILLEKLAKKYQIWDLVQVWYKESTGKNGPFIRDLATLILKYFKTPLVVTGIPKEIHIYSHNHYLWIYSRNRSERVWFDENVPRGTHYARFIKLDTSIDSLFAKGVSSVIVEPIFSECNLLKDKFWWSFGLGQCKNPKNIDTLLNEGNKSYKQSMSSILRRMSVTRLSSNNTSDKNIVFNKKESNYENYYGMLDMYWFEMKCRVSGTDGVFFYGWINKKLTKFPKKNRALTKNEQKREFKITIAKGCDGQILLNDWKIDAKYDTNNKLSWYFWCILHLCSCKSYKEPAGVVLELCCNY